MNNIMFNIVETHDSRISSSTRSWTRAIYNEKLEVPEQDLMPSNDGWYDLSHALIVPEASFQCLQSAQTIIINDNHTLEVEAFTTDYEGNKFKVRIVNIVSQELFTSLTATGTFFVPYHYLLPTWNRNLQCKYLGAYKREIDDYMASEI